MGRFIDTFVLCVLAIYVAQVSCMTCKGERKFVNDKCSLACTHKDYSSITFNITCGYSTAWADYGMSHVPSDLIKGKFIELNFNDCDFPANFRLQVFMKMIGLGAVNQIKINNPSSRFKQVRDFFLDTSISRIEIIGANIKNIPEDLLKSSDTWQLTLSDNRLTKIRNHDLQSMEDILELDLSINKISDIDPGALDKLTHLHSLDLSFNNLFSLAERTFKNLNALNKVDLNNNNLIDIPSGLFHQKNLQEIYLNDNELVSLQPKTFGDLPKLRRIELKNNKLSKLPQELFTGSNMLEWLTLDQNNLTILPDGVFRHASLKHLSLAFNHLTSLTSTALYGLFNLEYLDVSNNQLQYVTGDLCHRMPAIKKIDLSKNLLTKLHAPSYVPQSPPVDFSVFSQCNQLEKLKLNENKIGQMYKDWVESDNLKSLQLAYNNITSLRGDIMKIKHEINVQNNKLNTLNLKLIRFDEVISASYSIDPKLRDTKKILVRGNYWDCNCENMDFFRYVQNKLSPELYEYVEIVFDETDKCVSPPKYAGTLLHKVPVQDFVCDTVVSLDGDVKK